jgi:hypothetical protein
MEEGRRISCREETMVIYHKSLSSKSRKITFFKTQKNPFLQEAERS